MEFCHRRTLPEAVCHRSFSRTQQADVLFHIMWQVSELRGWIQFHVRSLLRSLAWPALTCPFSLRVSLSRCVLLARATAQDKLLRVACPPLEVVQNAYLEQAWHARAEFMLRTSISSVPEQRRW